MLNWNWETFPEWMAHLRALPKGVNTAMYLPMNPLVNGEVIVKNGKTTGVHPEQVLNGHRTTAFERTAAA